MRKIKIGIDVGGTFTHAVAVDIRDFSLVGKACVPTSHKAQEGVARGVVDSMHQLMESAQITADEIVLIAHSTTQATNALLEGDVAVVGIIGMGQGLEGLRAKQETNLKNIELSPGRFLKTCFAYIDVGSTPLTDELIRTTIAKLQQDGAQVIVASEAFGVDHPEREQQIVTQAEAMGLMATAASSISKLYGLRVRTRNPYNFEMLLAKMLETANRTEEAVRASGVKAPLMVMRSDGGIMDIAEMRRRPILTMLSGPAAGVAAALMYAKVSDGIFIEVGGTSSDISVIRNGKPQIKSAQIGGNRLYLQTLDVRTLGIAGGSVPRVQKQQITDVGPRSAHIAGLAYPAFNANADYSQIRLESVQPRPGDPSDYMAVVRGEERLTLTPTEASYFLGLVKDVGHGAGHLDSVKAAVTAVAQQLGQTPEAVAEKILTLGAAKITPVLKQLMREYKLDPGVIELVGGGGGASAIVPWTAKTLGVHHLIAENSEVISAIGAALGMIRDSVERSILNPTNDDLLQLRQAATASVIAMGAVPESVEVTIEIDTTQKKVTAIAMGTSEMRTRDLQTRTLSEEELKQICAKTFAKSPTLAVLGATERLYAIGYTHQEQKLLGLIKREVTQVRVIDREGTIRLRLSDCKVAAVPVSEVKGHIPPLIEELTAFGDAGGLVPDIYLLLGARIVDLSGLLSASQVLSLAESDLQQMGPDEAAVILAVAKR
jgi:N-methylhydantoinase A